MNRIIKPRILTHEDFVKDLSEKDREEYEKISEEVNLEIIKSIAEEDLEKLK